MRRTYLHGSELLIPPCSQSGKCSVRTGFVVHRACSFDGGTASRTQIKQHTGFLAGRKGQLLLKRAAGIAACAVRSSERTLLNVQRVALCAIGTDEAVAFAVAPIRYKIACEELIAVFFIMRLAEHCAVFKV